MKGSIFTRNYVLIIIIAGLTSFTHCVFSYVYPVYVLDLGGTNAVVGLLAATATGSLIGSRLLCGVLSDRWGRKRTFLLGSAVYALTTLGHCAVSGIGGLFVLRILQGAAQGLFFPMGYTMIADDIVKENMVKALGWMNNIAALPTLFAAPFGLWIYRNLSARTLFLMCFTCMLLGMFLILFVRESYRPSRKPQQKQPRMRAAVDFLLSLKYFF